MKKRGEGGGRLEHRNILHNTKRRRKDLKKILWRLLEELFVIGTKRDRFQWSSFNVCGPGPGPGPDPDPGPGQGPGLGLTPAQQRKVLLDKSCVCSNIWEWVIGREIHCCICCCKLNNTRVCKEHLFRQVSTLTGRNKLPIYYVEVFWLKKIIVPFIDAHTSLKKKTEHTVTLTSSTPFVCFVYYIIWIKRLFLSNVDKLIGGAHTSHIVGKIPIKNPIHILQSRQFRRSQIFAFVWFPFLSFRLKSRQFCWVFFTQKMHFPFVVKAS